MVDRLIIRDWRNAAVGMVLDWHEVPTYAEWLEVVGATGTHQTKAAYLRGVTEGIAFLLENVGHTLSEPDRDSEWGAARCKHYLANLQAKVLDCINS